jgi:hypothetical protein
MKTPFLIIAAVLVLTHLAPASEQSLADRLTRRVDTFESESDSTVEQLIELARRFHIPMGIEWVDEPSLRRARPVRVTGTTVRGALRQVIRQLPGYGFTLRDGVVHVYKSSMLTDRRNFLNIRFPEFGYEGQSLSAGSHWLRVRIGLLLHPGQGFIAGYGGFSADRDFDLPRISFSGENMSVRRILSKMAAKQGNALWVIGLKPNQLMEGEPYYAQIPGSKRGQASSAFAWQFIPLDPNAFNELTFASAFVEELRKAGLRVSRAGRSVMEGKFDKNYDAASIMTDKGIVDAVFFAGPADVSKIKITPTGRDRNTGHYTYVIENPPEPEQNWETAEEHYFTKIRNVLLITNSRELEAVLKKMAGERKTP